MKPKIMAMLLGVALSASMIFAGPGLGALIFSISLISVLFLYLASSFVSKTFKAPVPITFFAKRTFEEEENAKAPAQILWPQGPIVAF